MGFDLGQIFGQADSSIGNWFGGVGQGLFGNGSDPGALGTGQYQVPQYNINQQAFANPYGNQGQQWNTGQNMMLGRANQGAPTAGNAATYGAATSAGPNLGQYNQTFANQQGLANQYQQMAAGKGPSMANVQAQQQGQQNLQGQLAAMGSIGGTSNPALASYNIGQQAGQIQNQTNQNAVMGRTAEEMGAMGAEGNLYGQMQGGALGAAGMGMANNQFNATQQNQAGQFNAGSMNQFALANQQSQLAQNQMNNQMLGGYTQNEQGAISTGAQMGMQGQQLGVQNALGYGQAQAGAYDAAGKARSSWMTNLMQGGGSMLSMVGL